MGTPTVYARVSSELKDAVDDYAEARGMSLASAVTDLLARGLEAAHSEASVLALETRVRELEADRDRGRQAAGMVEERLAQRLGTCECGRHLTGRDLLVTGRCPECSRGVGALLVPAGDSIAPSGPTVDWSELAPFLAGLGVAAALVALAYAAAA